MDLKECSWKLSIRPGVILAVSLIWCYAVRSAVVPLPYPLFCVLLGAVSFTYIRTYEKDRWEITLSTKDLLVASSFLLLSLLVHWRYLFFSLGGDELYHAEQASFLLCFLREWLKPTVAALSVEEYRSSMWHLFDLRHMAVIDIWRVVTFLLFGFAVLGATILVAAFETKHGATELGEKRNLRYPRSFFKTVAPCFVYLGQGIAIAFAIWLGRTLTMSPEQHPPLRLLPLFISSLIFGLNNFAFRLPGIIVTSMVSFWVYRTISAAAPEQPFWWRYVISGLTLFIPIVFYVAETVEPSVFGYAIYVGVLLCAFQFLHSKNPQWIIIAATIAGLGLVLRQSTIVTWLLVGILFLFSGKLRNISWWWKVSAPFLLGIPYFFTVHELGHTAEAKLSAAESLRIALKNGVGLMAMLNTTTLPWVVFTVLLFLYALCRARVRELSLYLLFVPTFILFHIIWIYLWGLGRYQAEYVAPFIVYTIFLAALSMRRQLLVPVSILAGVLAITTLEVNSNLSLDTNYRDWPRMRITASANFPYREAFGFLKRDESEGRFALVGGQPWYGDIVAWLGGFSFYETAEWRKRQDDLDAFVIEGRSLHELYEFCVKHDIRYLMAQTGTRREAQHRAATVRNLITELEDTAPAMQKDFFKVNSFSGEHGGILDLYRVSTG